jgi:hypothetical protein
VDGSGLGVLKMTFGHYGLAANRPLRVEAV